MITDSRYLIDLSNHRAALDILYRNICQLEKGEVDDPQWRYAYLREFIERTRTESAIIWSEPEPPPKQAGLLEILRQKFKQK